MKKLFTLMVLGCVASLSANYGSCPNCPSASAYQGQGNYQNQGYQGQGYNQNQGYQGQGYMQNQRYQGQDNYQGQGYYQEQGYQGGNEAGYYKDGSRPVKVGTRPVTQDGRAVDQNQQYQR